MASYRSNGSQSRSSRSVSFDSSRRRVPTKPPKCHCGTKAVIRTVVKDGRNKGKTFCGCRHFVAPGIDCGCGYFLWYSDWLANFVDDDDDDAECLECPEKDVELMMLRRSLVTMNEENKSLKMKMKFVVVMCMVLGVICAMLCKPSKSGSHDLKLGFK